MPLPAEFSKTVKQIEASQQRYLQLSRERKHVRQTYMGLLLLLTMMVLFVTTWLALFLSKLVTRPLAALAEATQEISRGRLDYRIDVSAADEIGDLVRSFNRMAEELETSRRQIEASSRDAERCQCRTRPAPPADGNHPRKHPDRSSIARCRPHASRTRTKPCSACFIPRDMRTQSICCAGRAWRTYFRLKCCRIWNRCCAVPTAWE